MYKRELTFLEIWCIQP